MIILRDEKKIVRYQKIGRTATWVGFLILVAGFIAPFLGNVNNSRLVLNLQVVALPVGWILTQVGLYLSNRYVRRPRPDEVLDESLEKIAKESRLYHYILPVPHVLLTPAGPILFVTKYQPGDISVTNDKWSQRGVSALRKLFGQEGIGNPTREAEAMIGSMANYLRKHAPDVPEVPIGAIIVFTAKQAGQLDLKGSTIPAMHASKLQGFFKQKVKGPALPPAQYQALQAAFDKAIQS